MEFYHLYSLISILAMLKAYDLDVCYFACYYAWHLVTFLITYILSWANGCTVLLAIFALILIYIHYMLPSGKEAPRVICTQTFSGHGGQGFINRPTRTITIGPKSEKMDSLLKFFSDKDSTYTPLPVHRPLHRHPAPPVHQGQWRQEVAEPNLVHRAAHRGGGDYQQREWIIAGRVERIRNGREVSIRTYKTNRVMKRALSDGIPIIGLI